MPQSRPSWSPPARYKGPDVGDLLFAQDVAPRRHLAILTLLHRGDKARTVVRKRAQVGRDGACVDHVGAMAVRAIPRIGDFALVDLRRIAPRVWLLPSARDPLLPHSPPPHAPATPPPPPPSCLP